MVPRAVSLVEGGEAGAARRRRGAACYRARVVRRSLLGLMVALSALPAWGQPRGGVVLLHRPGEQEREAALFDALRIYTRDLGLSTSLGPDGPAVVSPSEVDDLAVWARREAAEAVVWFGGEGGRPVLYALRVATKDLRSTVMGGGELDEAARALALKVRALLVRGVPASDRVWATVPAAPAPPPTEMPAQAAPKTQPPPATATTFRANAQPDAASTARAPATVTTVVAAAPPRPPAAWLEASAGYQIGGPLDSTWLRQGLSVRAAVAFRRAPVAPFVDLALTTRPALDGADGHVELSDVPIGLGVAARWRHGRLLVAGGPRASLHVLEVSGAAPDGRRGSARLVTAGLGALGEVAWFLGDHVALAATVTAEALVPHRQIALEDPARPMADLGTVGFDGSVGLLFSVP